MLSKRPDIAGLTAALQGGELTGVTDRLCNVFEEFLPERYREALELRFAWEYSNQEIAKALKLNTSNVATLVARGRKLLIEKLQTEGYCYE